MNNKDLFDENENQKIEEKEKEKPTEEKEEEKKFEEVNSKVYDLFKKAEKIVAFNGPAMQLTIYTCILLLSWLGAKMIIGGSMQAGELSSIITYAWQILSSLMML